MFETLIKDMAALDEVVGIMLGGSRASNTNDEHSDYDVYVYTNKPLDVDTRKKTIEPYVKYMEFNNTFWEDEDDGILTNGIDIEFIYRDINTVEKALTDTLKGQVSFGYSTCFINNVFSSKILYEKDNTLTALIERLHSYDQTIMYDEIVKKNLLLLKDYMPSMHYQIEKAVLRDDIVSINHRLTAYFELVFDVLFALNKVTHPGEKRLLKFTEQLDIKPTNLKERITTIIQNAGTNNQIVLQGINTLSSDIYTLAKKQGYDVTYETYKQNK